VQVKQSIKLVNDAPTECERNWGRQHKLHTPLDDVIGNTVNNIRWAKKPKNKCLNGNEFVLSNDFLMGEELHWWRHALVISLSYRERIIVNLRWSPKPSLRASPGQGANHSLVNCIYLCVLMLSAWCARRGSLERSNNKTVTREFVFGLVVQDSADAREIRPWLRLQNQELLLDEVVKNAVLHRDKKHTHTFSPSACVFCCFLFFLSLKEAQRGFPRFIGRLTFGQTLSACKWESDTSNEHQGVASQTFFPSPV